MILSVQLDDATATALEAAAGRAGQTVPAFVADQLVFAFGPGRSIDAPLRQSRAQRRIMTERARIDRALAKNLKHQNV